MKRFLFFPLFVVFITLSISISFVGCDNQPVEPVCKEETQSLSKAIISDDSYTLDLDAEGPFIYYDCVTGIELLMHGKIMVNQVKRETPSGKIIWNGKVDYDYYDPIYLEGSDGSTWTLYKGLNPFHDMITINPVDGYKLTYKIHEFYKNNETGDKLKILIEGTWMEIDGEIKHSRENFKCIQKLK